jgi:hypothetical protein
MNANSLLHGLRTAGLALVAGAAIAAPINAQAAGHFGGGGHVGGAFHGGGGYGYHGGYGYRGGYGFRGGYGYGGYYGFRGGYGWGWWGWPVGGLFLATLPLYYSTLWWDGVPYYYANDNYYVWNGSEGGYSAVAPPPQVSAQASAASGQYAPPAGGTTDLFVYPKNAQSAQLQEQDKQECRAWAASQPGAGPANRGDNLRAQTACLEARGYSVK